MDPKASVLAVIEKPGKKVLSLYEEFEKFAFKGNLIDMAVGVIIGATFAKMLESLVKNLMMPLISLIMPTESDYTTWAWKVGDKTVPYGLFLGDIVNFLIVALATFVFTVKFLGWIRRFRAEAEEVKPVAEDVKLLGEIRDLLKAKSINTQ